MSMLPVVLYVKGTEVKLGKVEFESIHCDTVEQLRGALERGAVCSPDPSPTPERQAELDAIMEALEAECEAHGVRRDKAAAMVAAQGDDPEVEAPKRRKKSGN